MIYSLILWLGMLFCTNPTHTIQNHGNCPFEHFPGATTMDAPGTGGETGGIPKPPPPPPPPGSGT